MTDPREPDGGSHVAGPSKLEVHASDAATEAIAETGGGGAAKKKTLWIRTKAGVSTILAVVAAVTGVVTVIPILTADPSNITHLVTSAEVTASQTTEWAIPPEVILDEEQFLALTDMFKEPDYCESDGADWLETNATRLQRKFTLSVRSEAREGPMLALTDFRSTAERGLERGPITVRFVCNPGGLLPQSLTYAKLAADNPEEQAQVVRLQAGEGVGDTPTIALAFNLAPGESGTMPLELYSRSKTTGSIVTTVLTTDGPEEVVIPGSEFDIPGMLFGGEMYLITTEDGIACQRTSRGALEACELHDLAEELAAAKSENSE